MKTSRTLLSVSLLAWFTAFGSAQDLSQKVSFKSGAGFLNGLFKVLSNETGIGLYTNSQTQNEIVYANFKDVPLSEVMNKLADACGAEWAKEENGFRLVRTDALRKSQEAAEAKARAAKIKASIEKMRDELQKQGQFTAETVEKMAADTRAAITSAQGREGMRQIMGMQNMAPAARAITQMLAVIDPLELATLAPGKRLVLATSPTRMQRPLPGTVNGIINQFVKEQRILAETMAKQPEGPGRGILGFGGLNPDNKALYNNPAKTMLVVTRFGTADSFGLTLTVADSNGETMGNGFHSLGIEAMLPAEATPETNSGTQPAADNGKPIELSEATKQFIELAKTAMPVAPNVMSFSTGDTMMVFAARISLGEETAQSKLSPEWKKRILNCDMDEPMGWIANDVFDAIAKARGNVIACLPDRLIFPLAQAMAAPKSVEAVQKALTTTLDMEATHEGGWSVWKPAMQAFVREERVHRPSLVASLKALDSAARLTLNQKANYAANAPDYSAQLPVDGVFARWINPTAGPRDFGDVAGNLDILRLYGMMTDSQRNALLNAGQVNLSSLSKSQLDVVHNLVYHSFDGPRVQVRNPAQRQTFSPAGPIGGMARERTQILPTGVPGNGILKLRLNREQAVYGFSTDPNQGSVMTAQELAQSQMMAEAMRDTPNGAMIINGSNGQFRVGGTSKADKFKMAQQSVLTFDFQFAVDISMQRQLTDETYDSRGSVMTFSQLPQDFRDRVARSQAEMKAATQGATRAIISDGRGGRNVP